MVLLLNFLGHKMENRQIKKITVVFLLNISKENAKSTSQKYSRFFHSCVEFPNLLCGGTAPVLLWQMLPGYKEISRFLLLCTWS